MPIGISVTEKAVVPNATTATTAAVTTAVSGSVFVTWAQWSSAAQFVSITDSKSNVGWTQIGTELVLSDGSIERCYYVENATGGTSHTFTWTVDAAGPITAFVIEITGAKTSGALNASARETDAATPFVSPGITTTGVCALIGFMGVVGPDGQVTFTAGNSFTKEDEEIGNDAHFPGYSSRRFPVSAGTYNTSTTMTGTAITDSGNWVIAIEEATAAGPTTAQTIPAFYTTGAMIGRRYV